MAFLKAEKLHQEFDSVTVDVSFECEKGTMTSIVGPSGCGKTTVLRLLSGLNSVPQKSILGIQLPSSGAKDGSSEKIILDEVDITNIPSFKRQIGMVFQNHSLFDHLNVMDNVAYGLISIGVKKSEARKRAVDFLPQFELEGFEKRMPSTLSGGEMQRVALARTLIMNPKLVLFDEPLSALDAPLRKKLAALIKKLQKDLGFTGIMVTHDVEEAKTISDKIILMKKGQIYWQGNPQDFSETMISE